ncbi:hypothetical protein EDB83DRAFT_2314099 [Lactarius deliciosus]|nr:hypothetical protein EDB83DRAFT_2314099 [Lactarius deliciosus]
MHGSRSDPPPAVISNRDQVRAISFLAIAIQLGAMVLIGYRFWKSIHWTSKASECRLAALSIVVESDILYSITTTSLFGLSLLNSAAIFATGLGLISLVDWNSSLKQEATRIAEKYLLARNERTQISQPYFKRSTICPPRRSRGLNHIMKRSRTDWIKRDVASLQELQWLFSVQKATTPSPLRFARRTANPVVRNAMIQTLVGSPVSINSLLGPSVRTSGRNAHGLDDSPEYYTLDGFMQLNGHDLLKIDVEGAEFDNADRIPGSAQAAEPVFESSRMRGMTMPGRPRSGWPFSPKAILVYVNYNQEETKPGQVAYPRFASGNYSFMNIRGNHPLVYKAAGGADKY